MSTSKINMPKNLTMIPQIGTTEDMTPELDEHDIYRDEERNILGIDFEREIFEGFSNIGSREQAAKELEKAYADRFPAVSRKQSMKEPMSISNIPSRRRKRKDQVLLQDSPSDSHASCSQLPSSHQTQHSQPKVSPSMESGSIIQLASIKSKKPRKCSSGSYDQGGGVGRHSKHIEILVPVPERGRQHGDILHANTGQQHQILPKHIVVRERRAPKKLQREDILVRIMKQQMKKKIEKLRLEEALHRL